MDDHLLLLEGIDGWDRVLACYQPDETDTSPELTLNTTPDSSDSEADLAEAKPRATQAWKRRMVDTLDLDEQTISRIHGRLVAAGLLEMDVIDRTCGLCYRLTRDGKRVLRGLAESVDRPPYRASA